MFIRPLMSSGSTILTGLVSWWALDETSGTRVDAHGSNDLTDNNTVGVTTGKVDDAAHMLTANSESLSNTSPINLEGGERDWTIAMWFQRTNGLSILPLVHKGSSSAEADTDYVIAHIDATNTIRLHVSDGSSWEIVDSTTASVNTWYYLICSHEISTKTIRISLNAGTEASTIYTGTANEVSSTRFILGNYSTFYYHGYMDEAAFWSRLLTSDERAELYNSGSGIAYPG